MGLDGGSAGSPRGLPSIFRIVGPAPASPERGHNEDDRQVPLLKVDYGPLLRMKDSRALG